MSRFLKILCFVFLFSSQIISCQSKKSSTLNDVVTLNDSDLNSNFKPLFVHPDTSSILSVEWSSDGKKILTSSLSKFFLWDSVSGKLIKSCDVDKSNGLIRSVYLSPDTVSVVVLQRNLKPTLWSIQECAVKFDFGGFVHSFLNTLPIISFSNDGRFIALSDYGFRKIDIFNSENGKLTKSIETPRPIDGSIKLSANNKIILSGSSEKNGPRLWDIDSGKLLLELKFDPNEFAQNCLSPTFIDNDTAVACNAVSGEYFSIVWDINTASIKQKYKYDSQVLKEIPSDVTFSPDGSIIVASNNDNFLGWLSIWRRNQEVPVRAIRNSSDKHFFETLVKFSPDGKSILVTTKDTARVVGLELLLPNAP